MIVQVCNNTYLRTYLYISLFFKISCFPVSFTKSIIVQTRSTFRCNSMPVSEQVSSVWLTRRMPMWRIFVCVWLQRCALLLFRKNHFQLHLKIAISAMKCVNGIKMRSSNARSSHNNYVCTRMHVCMYKLVYCMWIVAEEAICFCCQYAGSWKSISSCTRIRSVTNTLRMRA